MNPSLSVVIPVHNEEECIENTLKDLCHTLEKESIDYEVILVNDHSTDTTGSILDRISQQNSKVKKCDNTEPNGFGFTVRTGFRHCQGDWVAVMMADASEAEHREGYLSEQKTLMRWMQRYPDTVCSLTHGFPWRLYVAGESLTVPAAIWEPFENPNCNMEVCFPVRLGDLFDYPYRQVGPVFEQMIEHIGADHLLWGTDMPFQNRFCTYRQSRQWIEQTCDFLSPQDLAWLMGATAGRLLGIESEP